MMDIYQLRILLQYTQPPVWRQVQVPADMPLGKLHHVIQIAMGWLESHLHAFHIKGDDYGPPDLDMPDMGDERKVRLGDVAGKGDRLRYEYDFGDGWTHLIEVENIVPTETGARYPRCIAGNRACPPEDCGGPPGYQDLLDILADPGHAEREDMLEWLGGDFDPEAFDAEEANKRMWKYLAPPRAKPAEKSTRRPKAKKRTGKRP